jgi:2-alkenal reductase
MSTKISIQVLASGAALAVAALACQSSISQLAPPTSAPANPVAVVPQVIIPPVSPSPLPPDVAAKFNAEEAVLVDIYHRVDPSVVNIVISAKDRTGALVDTASGSGFVIDTDGHIVTNNHVVDQADDVRVTFPDGAVMHADIVGTDLFSDLAVIKVSPPQGYTFTVAELGDSDTLQAGQTVIAIGNPFGLTGSMTVGIVSAVGRTLPSGNAPDQGSFQNPLIIQTDAAINPGNSGGPLLDSQGKVIGVNAAIRSDTGANSGIGFAIPVNTVKMIVKQLIASGHVRYAYLGITSQSDPTLAELSLEHNLPVQQGVLIASVAPGGPADQAGLKGGTQQTTFRGHNVVLGGDIITAVDGKPVRDFDTLIGYLIMNTVVGQTINLTVIRDGQTLQIPLTLGARPG